MVLRLQTFEYLLSHPQAFDQDQGTLEGWVRSVRVLKNMAFIKLQDGSCLQGLQVVCPSDSPAYLMAKDLGVGAALKVSGTLVATPDAPQPLEVLAQDIDLVGPGGEDYPLQKKRHGFEFLRTQAHLRPRTNTFGALYRVRSALAFAIHRYFHDRGFVLLHPPVLTATDAEGAGEMFCVRAEDPQGRDQDFFGKPAHLSVSGQLNAEAFAQAFKKTYTFSPTFRAENSHTTRHAAEFWMVEPEIAFAGLDDLLALAEDFIKVLAQDCLRDCREDMVFFDTHIEPGVLSRLEALSQASFARMTYDEAIGHLEASGRDFAYPVSWGLDLQTEHERYLTDDLIGGPVFVTDYPSDIKAFYMRANDDGRTVAAMDLLVPGVGEMIGGSQREDRLEVLERKMAALGMDAEAYAWYLDLRRYGGTPHAGFGLGFDRLLMYVTGMKNIRDVVPFPRVPGVIDF